MFDALEQRVKNTPGRLSDIPLSIAKMVREAEELTTAQKEEAMQIIRDWTHYASEHHVLENDLHGLRAHLELFAERFQHQMNQESTEQKKITIPLSQIHLPDGSPVQEIVNGITNPQIFADERILLYGGVARAIMRAYLLGQGRGSSRDLAAELPINDVDMMIVGPDEAEQVAQKYKSELGGTRIIIDPKQEISTYLKTVDVTMNQAIIYNGTLITTREAMHDAEHGIVRSIGSEKVLFQPDSIRQADGHGYLLRSGFYRNLAVLLRGRGNTVIVSKENLEAEKERIGRYWLVLLFVKLLPMKDTTARDEAVLGWHQIARDIGSTETNTPRDFLNELLGKFPDFDYNKKDNVFRAEDQARWLIGKLARRGLRTIKDDPAATPPLPKTYTPANITLRPYEGEKDLATFWTAVDAYRK